MFKTITNAVILDSELSNNFDTAKNQILEAIKSGQNFIINRSVSNSIPEIFIKNNEKLTFAGESIKLTENTTLNICTNEKFLIKIFHNGTEIKNTYGKNINVTLTKTGKYRVELLKDNMGFLYSNPIVVY